MIKEIENYRSALQDLRGQVKALLEGIPPEALDWRPIEGEGELATNSLAAMAVHLAGSEAFWMKEIVSGQPVQRDRNAEFLARGMTADGLKEGLENSANATEEILSSLTVRELDESRSFRERTVTVRWAILHVIEHIATHVGHMQLTRQLWMARRQK